MVTKPTKRSNRRFNMLGPRGVIAKLAFVTKLCLGLLITVAPVVAVRVGLPLLLYGIEDNLALTYRGNQPLYDAIRQGDERAVRALLDAGASPDSKSRGLWTAFAPDEDPYYDHPPLFAAIYAKRPDLAGLLLEKGADSNWRGKRTGVSPLMIAAREKQVEAARVLLGKGVDVNQKDNDGATALLYAVKAEDVETVKVLLAARADVNVVTKDGGTVLRYGQSRAASWRYGRPPTWWMCRSNHPEVTAILKRAGAQQ
jgi:ankyrin repeat protein